MRTWSKMILLLLATVLGFGFDAVVAQSTGNITGRVLNAESGRALAGAHVLIDGTSYGAATSQSGTYRLRQIPPGEYTLVVRYIGFTEKREEITLSTGQSLELDFELNPAAVEGEDVVVTALAEGRTRALNIQRSSNNIRNVISTEQLEQFADPNLSGALSRISGVSFQTDRGEAGEVYLRGLSPNLSNVTMNGAQMASTDTDGREVWLGGMTGDIVTNLEVIKAVTPDMDANTIGGTINIDTNENIGDSPIFRANLSGGISQLSDKGQGQVGIQYGQRFGDLQVFMTGSYQNNNRETHDIRQEQYDWDFGDGSSSVQNVLEEQRLSTYVIPRKRYGGSLQLNYDLNRDHSIYLRTLFNRFDDSQTRNQHRIELDREDPITRTVAPDARFQVDGRTYERQLTSYSAIFGGDSGFSRFDLAYRVAYSRGVYDEPFRDYFRFRHATGATVEYEDRNEFYYPQLWVTDGTNVTDPANYEFTYYEERVTYSQDDDIAANFDVTTNLSIGDRNLELKFGALGRYKVKDHEFSRDRYDFIGDENVSLGRFATFDNRTFLNRFSKFT